MSSLWAGEKGMRRTKNSAQNGPDAILTADWHLRENQPICRTDDFWGAQWKKVDAIRNLQIKHTCPVIHAGDLFDHWKPSPYLLTQTLLHSPQRFWTIYGNHDLPQHNLDLVHKTGVYTLISGFGEVNLLQNGVHWGQVPNRNAAIIADRNVLVWHVMTWTKRPPWPGCTDLPAEELLDIYHDYDLIVTGHSHKSFVVEKEGRILVNPGSLTRQEADQISHTPRVYLWYAKTNTVKAVRLPMEENVISREHIERKEQRDERIEAFVERLNDDWDTGVSFEENLDRFEKKNKIQKPVMEIIRRAIAS